MLLALDGLGPRYAQITRALRGLIQTGVLQPGTRLPASRDLARDLGCARNIVLLAYEQLALEGYLAPRQGAGTYVSPELPEGAARASASPLGVHTLRPRLSRRGKRRVEAANRARAAMTRQRACAIDFMYGVCEPDARVVARLRSAFASALRGRAFLYGAAAGDPSLRQQLADRIHAARGIARSPEQIVVTTGSQQTLDICARLLVDDGDRVVVEDPGYPAAHAIFAAAGAKVVRAPVDEHGLDPARLPQSGQVRAVYVTPSHQFPTGVVMPVARRYALLEWARRRRAYIIEDDYDGEFRYTGRPIAALAGLEPEAPVIYCGTFAKSLFPSLRLGYLAVPNDLVSAATSCKWLCDIASSLLLQRTVAQLMATGEYDRHVRRMQKRYRARRQALLSSLRKHLGEEAQVDGGGAGLHVSVWLPMLQHHLVDPLIEACTVRGVGVYSIAAHAKGRLPRAGLLLGYGLTDTSHIDEGVRRLGDAYREISGRGERRQRK